MRTVTEVWVLTSTVVSGDYDYREVASTVLGVYATLEDAHREIVRRSFQGWEGQAHGSIRVEVAAGDYAITKTVLTGTPVPTTLPAEEYVDVPF